MYPLLLRAFWWIGAALLKDSLSYEISDSRLLIDCGMLWDVDVALIVTLSPCLPKMSHRSFLICPACRGDALVTPRPSSLYKPKL